MASTVTVLHSLILVSHDVDMCLCRRVLSVHRLLVRSKRLPKDGNKCHFLDRRLLYATVTVRENAGDGGQRGWRKRVSVPGRIYVCVKEG